jgi:hypothetical protein
MTDVTRANTDRALWHPLLVTRWAVLDLKLAAAGIPCRVVEGYRSDERQAWLYAQGRTRPGLIVTNAASAKLSAHGYMCKQVVAADGSTILVPGACALDIVPIGADGKPWTADDDWPRFVAMTTDAGSVGWNIGLIHFHAPGKQVWDKPHLQLREWSDSSHDLVIGA